MTQARYKSCRMEDAATIRDLTLYRPNVGVVVFCPLGRVWLGQRTEHHHPDIGAVKGEVAYRRGVFHAARLITRLCHL